MALDRVYLRTHLWGKNKAFEVISLVSIFAFLSNQLSKLLICLPEGYLLQDSHENHCRETKLDLTRLEMQ